MKKHLIILVTLITFFTQLQSQTNESAGNWKTWFISSGKDYRLPPPSSNKKEVEQVIALQEALDSAGRHQILYWNAGAPGYRWQSMVYRLWMSDTSFNGAASGALANMLLSVGMYD